MNKHHKRRQAGRPEGRRDLIAGFDDPQAARRAADELTSSGFQTVRVDPMTQHPRMPSRDDDNAGYPDTFTGEGDPVARAGLIASTAVSGMAIESDPFSGRDSYDPFPGARYVLTVVIEAPRDKTPGLEAEAERIIKRHGGAL